MKAQLQRKSRPILMSSEMVKAILENRKTQTRRVVKENFTTPISAHRAFDVYNEDSVWWDMLTETENGYLEKRFKCPFGKVGDVLWVRETWNQTKSGEFVYKENGWAGKCKPSIFMPREASRVSLEITNIRVEKLQDISTNDIEKEGIKFPEFHTPGENKTVAETWHDEFMFLWNEINKKHCWASNPFVWVLEFIKI